MTPINQAINQLPFGISPFIFYPALLLLFLIFYTLVKGERLKNQVNAHWHHIFNEPPFSAQEFFLQVETLIKEKKIPRVTLSRITYSQGSFWSPRREYLRVGFDIFVFDICAAPYGKRYFVSWWLGETGRPIRDFLANLPVVGKLFTKRSKTFFEMDTEILFKETVKECVNTSIKHFTEVKGIRQLSEPELLSTDSVVLDENK